MQNYELMTIAKATLSDDKAKAVSKEISDLVVANNGKIIKSDFWGKRKLAYEIKGAKEGYYDLIRFELSPENISKLKTKIKLMDNIIRYLFTSVSE